MSRSKPPGLKTPQELGCRQPFALTYKARLLTQSDQDREDLRGFLQAYRTTAQQLAAFLVNWFRGSLAERTAASLLVWPKHFYPEVLESPAWQAVSTGETTGLLPKKWAYLIEDTLYQNFRALAGRDKTLTKAGETVRKIWAKFSLPTPTGDEFERIFSSFTEASWRSESAKAVQSALRSYFSKGELTRREGIERNVRRAALYTQAPGFFNWLSLWLEDNRAFVQACRVLRAVRRELLVEKIDRAVLRACQSAALLQRLDARALWPRLTDNSINAIAAANPEIVARVAAAIPTPIPTGETETDAIRRFCSTMRPIESLEREPALIKELLSAIQREWHCFAAEELEAVQNNIVRHGPFFRHRGWKDLCASNHARDQKVVALVRDAREYARLLRPIQQAVRKEDADFWPLLPCGQRFGWVPAPVPSGAPANTAAVTFDLPDYIIDRAGKRLVHKKRKITVLLRGHLPGNAADQLAQPMDVKAGQFQFRPDRRKAVFGQHPQAVKRHVFFKAQAIHLIEDGAGLAGGWRALHMVEAPLLPSKEVSFLQSLKPGHRLGVLILLPGGSILCDVLVFERTAEPLGWKLVTVEETRARTDAGMKTGSTRGNPQPWVCKRRPFVRIDSAAVDARLAQMLAEGERHAVPDVDANRALRSWSGRVRSAICETAYKQIAARIERLLSWNRCYGVLIAGGGFLRGQTSLQHPFRQFYELGTKSGYLFNAINRLGLPWSASSARPARVWVKDFLDAPENVRELRLGHVFRRLRRAEMPEATSSGAPGISSAGSVTHISRDLTGNCAIDYPVNAGWAVLLAWANPAFKLALNALGTSLDAGS